MKLEINQGADLHIFLNHLVGSNGRTNEIANPDEFPSLSYSANSSVLTLMLSSTLN